MDTIMVLLLGVAMLLLVGIVVGLIYEIVMAIYRKTLRYEIFYTDVPVCKKEYEEEYTTFIMAGGNFIMAGKVIVPQFYDDEYNVYLMYEGESHCIDSEELYKAVNVGDTVRVKVHKGYNKRNEVKDVYLSI